MGRDLQLWETSIAQEAPLADSAVAGSVPLLLLSLGSFLLPPNLWHYVELTTTLMRVQPSESAASWVKKHSLLMKLKQLSGSSIAALVILDDPFFVPCVVGVMGQLSAFQ